MNATRFPRGSVWRRWDLHVHTPHSALNNGFGADIDHYAAELFRSALAKDIAVIGVTDYFSIAGYRDLKRIQSNGNDALKAVLGEELAQRTKGILLLPNIELRSSIVIPTGQDAESRVNFHVVFSDDLSPDEIDEHFLRELKFTAQSAPASADERWSITRSNIEALGKKLKADHEAFRDRSDFVIGLMNAVVSHEDVTEVLERQSSRFKNKYLLIVAADEDLSACSWNGQGHLQRKLFIQKAHMLFSGNANTREFGLGRKHISPQAFLSEFRSFKPCIHGSDAHSFDRLFAPAQGRTLWLKADPTFRGLAQLLNEPETRIFIGAEPPHLVRTRENSTKYMTGVTFERTSRASLSQQWFSGTVPINLGLVAVIGNKGSGKSALADVLALLADSRSQGHFSFLRPERFLSPKLKLGEMFEARLDWSDSQGPSKLLSARIDQTLPERVKYIPQNFLEAVCTDLKTSNESEFGRELTAVIFSHVERSDRFGKDTLADLIDYLTEEKEKRIGQLLDTIHRENKEIELLRQKGTLAHRTSIAHSLDQKRAELEAHDQARPPLIGEPAKDPATQDKLEPIKLELLQLVDEAKSLDEVISSAKDELSRVSLRAAAARRLLDRVANFEATLSAFLEESSSDAKVLGIDPASLITLSIATEPVQSALSAAEDEAARLRSDLSTDVPTSLAARRREISIRTSEVRGTLDEPNRTYQEYLHRLGKWESRRAEIVGTEAEANSVRGLELQLEELKQVPTQVAEAKSRRLEALRGVLTVKRELLADYRRLYAPVQEFIDKHPVSEKQGALRFSASIAADRFADNFFAFLHLGRKGSFQGEEDARQRITDLLAASDFSSDPGTEEFLRRTQECLEFDLRAEGRTKVEVADQLRDSKSEAELYDYLYGLTYLKPRFELTWQGKSLDELSPGERGTLLLVFYLLIDRRDVPLIVDQPEENLDNQTIATLLVPAIQYARERRQIVLVTHNPNLAVVCDADQIIHSRMDKAAGSRISYTSGSLEEPLIAKFIVDVLEGTKPAFDLRDAKYEVLEST